MQTAQSAVLLGQYRLEDSSWGVVTDSSGNARNGVASGSPAPIPAIGGAARTGATGTCGYGSFLGGSGELNVPNLPVNLSAGAKTSVSFWMKWSGVEGVMPIGWQGHDLWLVGGSFGFNTANSDVYGINSTGLANNWHHVVAVFTNGSVTSNSLYIDGVAQVLSQKLSTPNNGQAVVSSTLRISGWGNDSNYKFNGLIDEVKVFDGALTLAEVSTLYNETHACPTGLTVQTTSIGGIGTFSFTGTNGLPTSLTPITTTVSNTPTSTIALTNVAFTSYNTATSISEASLPAGYTLTSASCVDANNTPIAGVTLLGNTLTIPASAVVLGANITCTFVNSIPAQLIAQYHLEDASWGAVSDSGGNNRHGTVAGSPVPTRANATPAIVGATGTCGYGSFTGGTGEITVTGLPVNLTVGAKTSVSFWMRWDGTASVMPIGWQQHDLWLTGGFFGFNTGNGDVYGINSTGLANSWHHVVAIFTNGSVVTNSLYIDGVGQVLSQKQSSPLTSTAIVNSTLHISGWGASTGYKFRGLIDQVKVYNGALSATEVSAIYAETHNCSTATLSVKKANQLICDAVNGMSNPKHIPSAMVKWNVMVSNVGSVAANLNQLADALSGNTIFDPNLVVPSNVATCSSATGYPASAIGKGFKFNLTGTTRPAANYPKYLTSSNADSDGASHATGNVSIQYPLAMPAESGYSAGELRPGETALVDFNVTVQ